MFHKIAPSTGQLHRSQRGMTGLETAIILIAFVTVASVLAYAVLSAGIFSAERGKATVYRGLESAQGSLEVRGSVLGISTDNSSLNQVQFGIGLTIPDQKIDTDAMVVNYYDEEAQSGNVTATFTKNAQSTERGSANVIENDEQFVALVTVPASFNTNAYDTFTVQVIPPSGASLTIKRTLPGSLTPKMDLK
jgi:flagellin FlaB